MLDEGAPAQQGLLQGERSELGTSQVTDGLRRRDPGGGCQVEVGRGGDGRATGAGQEQADLLGRQRRLPPRAAFGATSREPDHSGAALVLRVLDSPAVGAASSMSLGSTWPSRPALGVSSQI